MLGGVLAGGGVLLGADEISRSIMNAGNSVEAGINLGVAEVGANFAGVINQQDSILDEIKDKAGQTINVTKNYNQKISPGLAPEYIGNFGNSDGVNIPRGLAPRLLIYYILYIL